jgi:hypothetical protein
MALNRSHNPGRGTIQREFSLRSAAFQTAPILCPALRLRLLVQEAAELEPNGVSVVNVLMNCAAIGIASRVALAKAHRSTRAACTISSQAGLATGLAVALISTMILAPGVAPAQSPNGTIKEFGLIGTWADDCNKRPAPSNQHATFTVNSRGAMLLRNDFGPDYGDMIYRILEATRLSQFRLSLRQVLTTDSEVALDTVMLKTNARVRIWSSRGVDGRQYVEDGLVPSANNRETGWMERCDMRSASRTSP